jgi:hypothetical protein
MAMERTTVLLLSLLFSTPGLKAKADISIELDPASRAVVFDYRSMSCGADDMPDAPVRAVRLLDGTVRLFASSSGNYTWSGKSVDELERDCRSSYRGKLDDDPSTFDDRGWISSVWTQDGKMVSALVHIEFHGHRRPMLCPSVKYVECWYNSIVTVQSSDGGQTFVRDDSPGMRIAPRARFRPGGQAGFFSPSNVVAKDGRLFFFAYAARHGDQQLGNCLWRLPPSGSEQRLAYWIGSGFEDVWESPYLDVVSSPPCRVVSRLPAPVASVVRHEPSGLFIAILATANGKQGSGIYTSESSDLVTWSEPRRLIDAPVRSNFRCGGPQPLLYPSLIDPRSKDRNFGIIGNDVYLFAATYDGTTCNLLHNLKLVRYRVNITM